MWTFNKPYIVAEMNSSHMGKLSNAMAMVDEAKRIGCSAVKFQSWSVESLYCADYYRENPMAKRMVAGFSLSEESLKALAEHCGEIGIDFSSTPYSKGEIDFLAEECNAPFIKIASMDLNNLDFLRYAARKNKPIVLSTGMGTQEEILRAVNTILETGNEELVVLHCVSRYPTALVDMNLNNISMLKNLFPTVTIGLSDHTTGYEAAIAAVAMGAPFIEKHFTLNNQKIGWDNQMATEPAEFAVLIEKCNQMYQAMGSFERILTDWDMEQKKKMRRSCVTAHDLQAGHIISMEDLDYKRPGTGIPLEQADILMGKQVATDIPKDSLICVEHLLQGVES